jgi:hypothetical protein
MIDWCAGRLLGGIVKVWIEAPLACRWLIIRFYGSRVVPPDRVPELVGGHLTAKETNEGSVEYQ